MKNQNQARLAERLRSLPPRKRELLELQLKHLDLERARTALLDESDPLTQQTFTIVPVPRDAELPSSYSQLREWFLDQLEPGNPAYHVPAALRLRGSLDPRLLAASLNEIVRRHESLRTTFPASDGQPVQVIAPRLEVTMPLVDLRALPAERREAEAERLAASEAVHPFVLARGPLVRIRLLRLGSRDHVVCLTMHHIVSDGWSMRILIREMVELYAAFREGRPSPLPELAVQYADFAVAQHRWLRGERLERLFSYWRERLGSPPAALDLPSDRPRSGWVAAVGATRPLTINAALTRSLRNLSRRLGTSLFMTTLGALKTLLRRYTGQQDLCVGTFIAGRNRPEIEPLIGFFINTLALRTDLGGDPSFQEVLKRVQKVTLGAYEHQDLPFERLLDALQIERSLSHTPLFQVMLVFQNLPRSTVDMDDLSFSSFGSAKAQANFELTLWLNEIDDGLAGDLEYNPRLFDATTIQRLSRHLLILLEEALAVPEQAISALPVLSGGERQQLVGEWSTAPRMVRYPATFRELFETQAECSPEAIALIDLATGKVLSYRELDRRANRLAHHLAQRVFSEVRVGLLLERSDDLVVGMLGVLKAGGAYVPLDPSYPRERLALILEDAGMALLLTHRGRDEVLPDLGERAPEVVALDRDGERIAACSCESPATRIPGESAAYAIYTSGSAGRPKGVEVSHRALAWYAAAAIAHYELVPEDRVLQLSSISFDNSVEEIFPCLARGATLVLRSEQMTGSMAELLRRCRERAITALSPPTALWHELVAEVTAAPESWPPTLRILCVGGERMLPDRVAGWRRAVGRRTRLMNTYGPTETTVVATLCELTPEAAGEGVGDRLPIGRPVPNARTYVLDRWLRAVPIGVAGELCIAGDGVARGYLGHPATTAERFVPSPSATAGERLYRTGDLVRLLADGNLEFLGRVDDQVKIRGFRIEPGEIEALLDQHPEVREAAVAVREDRQGMRRLVAYVVPRDEAAELGGSELREFLAAGLPEYMVPVAFVRLEGLPRTPSGKIDRRALPAPERDQLALASCYVAPRTPTEEVLAGIWAECLHLERIGVHDDFFALGGHSLLLTQVIARIRRIFQVEVPLDAFFSAPTVAELAPRVEAADQSELPPIRPVSRDLDLPVSFAQERLWFLSQLDPENTSYHVPRTFGLRGRLDVAALERAYEELIRRHEVLRTSFPTVGGRPLQRIHPPSAFQLPEIDLRSLSPPRREAELRRLIDAFGRRLFDLERGPLLCADLVRLDADEHALIQSEHHLVHDGWTEGVLVGDLLELYSASAERRPPRLPELEIQFADFAYWQRQWIRGEVLERQLCYWRERLAGAPALSELPADRPRPRVQSYRGRARDFGFSVPLSQGLTRLSRGRGVTLFMTMLAAFKTLLHRYGGQEDLVVGTGVANRRLQEIEGILGMVINTLALRTDLTGDPPFTELLERVRAVCLGAYGHEDLPFEKVVEALAPERTLSHSPLFQTMFAFFDAPMPAVNVAGLSLSRIEAHNRSAKFDLVVIVMPPSDEDGEAGAHFEWATDLFDTTTILRLAQHYRTLMAGAVADPEQPLSQLPIITAAERRQLVEWSRTASEYPRASTLPRLLEAQAERTPEAVAVAFDDHQLSYHQLNLRANRLAHHLRRLGVGRAAGAPEALVGLAMARSLEAVVAILAILKAGGAYLPLDFSYPTQRLAWMLEDAGAALLITREEPVSTMSAALAERGVKVVCLDRDATAIAAAGDRNPPSEATAESLAYVIYTSGSTGIPKGVAVTHRAVVRLIFHTNYVALGPEERIAHASTISFDAATFELWGALLHGARLEGMDHEVTVVSAAFAAAIRERGITVLFVTTALLNQLAAAEPTAFAGVRHLLFGGEAADPRWVREVLERAGGQSGDGGRFPGRLLHVYGPTESTTFATWQRVREVPPGARTVPIGAALANTEVHVVGRHLAPVPVGAVGDLLIGGDGLARGYLNRPGLSAERFIPDPFASDRRGGRVYRTGDLVRYLPDGQLEFVGRRDFQVKIRGFRIELGEIEAVLGDCPGVREAAVVVREDGPGGKRLVAYLVLADGVGDGESHDLRAYLKTRLPDYMIPAFFVTMDELPLSPTGKVDRRALRALAAPELDAERPYEAPSTPRARSLAAIFQAVLEVGKIGVSDNFFELGGHSLLATQVLNRIREEFGVEVSMRGFFESPTVAGLDEMILEGQMELAGDDAVARLLDQIESL